MKNTNIKSIWILNHYATGMFFDKGGRHYCFAKYLKQNGYDVTVFCASTIHNQSRMVDLSDNLFVKKNCDDIGVPFVFVKTRKYSGNGKARAFNMLDYYRNVLKAAKLCAEENCKPDVIYASSVHPLALLAGIKLAKRFGAECVCEVRDLWPESFLAYDVIKKNNAVLKILYSGEKWLYKKADKLIFTMEGGMDYITDKGWDTAHGGPIDLNKVYHINNGVDLEVFDYNREHYTLTDVDLTNKDTFKVVYTGSIRRVNEIHRLIEVAGLLNDRKNIIFLLYGDGTERDELEKYCRDTGLNNVKFKGRVEKKYIPYVLSCADLNVLNYAPNSILRYGWSMNKVFDYLASSKPVLINFNMSYSLFDKFDCGVAKSWDSSEEYAAQILRFHELPDEEYHHMCSESRRAAEAYDFKVLTEKLISVLES